MMVNDDDDDRNKTFQRIFDTVLQTAEQNSWNLPAKRKGYVTWMEDHISAKWRTFRLLSKGIALNKYVYKNIQKIERALIAS